MTELYHFSTIEQVLDYFCLRKLKNHLIIVNERYIFNTDSDTNINIRNLEIGLQWIPSNNK